MDLSYQTTKIISMDWPSESAGKNPLRERLSSAKSSFTNGFQKAMMAQTNTLPVLFSGESNSKRGFMIEGAAMALTLKDVFNKTHFTFLKTFISQRPETEKILSAIGAGWAAARLKKNMDWQPDAFSAKYADALADGYGFYHGIFTSLNLYKNRQINPNYFIGIGRSLWFKHTGRSESIIKEIQKCPEIFHGYIWRGIGIACAFTGCADFSAKDIEKKTLNYLNQFREGLNRGNTLLNALAL